MDFSEALREMRQAKTMARAEWKGTRLDGEFVGLQEKNEESGHTEYLWKERMVRFVDSAEHDPDTLVRQRFVWCPEMVDILATDWEIVDDA